MPPSKRKKQLTPEQINQRLKDLVTNPRVTVLLDVDDSSQEAKMGASYSYDEKNRILTIVVNALSAAQRKIVLGAVRQQFEDGGLILKNTKQETLTSYTEYQAKNEYKNILEFFAGILTWDDFEALKLSLYLRSEKEKGNHKYISTYKKDIRNRFGDRGANISNLCSAGYFENELMPLYNKVTRKEFNEYYEIVVGKKARALFVFSNMTIEELQIAFNETLDKALKYRMEDFRVHGIGDINVDKLKQFFSEMAVTKEAEFVVVKGYEKQEPFSAIEYVVKIVKRSPA